MFEFLEDYRDVSIPSREMEGVELTCRLGAGLPESEVPATAFGQLREFWHHTSGGPLLVDEQFGICGLTLYDPTQAKQRTLDRIEAGYEISESDRVIGEFVGDTDMLLIDDTDRAIISTGSYPRDDWYTFESLSDVLSKYIEAGAEKYWERTIQ